MHKKNLLNFATQLASDFGKYDGECCYLDLDKIPEMEQRELAYHILEANDRETTECVYGDDFTIDSDYNCALLAMLKKNTPENRDKFCDTVLKNIVTYFKNSMEVAIEEGCDEYCYRVKDNAGFSE